MHPWLHFKTITRHKLLVMKYCFRIGLYKQGLLHDLSKYSPTEFLVGCKYYQGTRSPNNAEREDLSLIHIFLICGGSLIIIFKEEITMISKEKKQAIMKEYARCEGDTGSPEVQVAVLTARIQAVCLLYTSRCV